MIEVYTRKDLEKVVEEYIKLRETVGLARDTAKFGAIETVVNHATLRKAVIEETSLIESKAKTDKLPPLQ